MDPTWRDFVIKIVDAVAWPVASIILAVLILPELRKLIPLISRIRYGNLAVEFERDIIESQQLAEKVAGESAIVSISSISSQLSSISPRAAIVQGWIELESLLAELPGSDQSMRPIFRRIEAWRDSGHIGQDTYDLFNSVRRLRNKAVHLHDFDSTFDASTAQVYLGMIELLKSELTKATS